MGTHCESNTNDCLANPCKNGGKCFDSVNDFACVCKQGFTGKDCSFEINECHSMPCMNNGFCVDHQVRTVFFLQQISWLYCIWIKCHFIKSLPDIVHILNLPIRYREPFKNYVTVVYFDQRLGAACSKCWSKYTTRNTTKGEGVDLCVKLGQKS